MSTYFLLKQKLARVGLLLLAICALVVSASSSQALPKKTQMVARANQGTVGVISGGFGSTNLRIVADLATVLNQKNGLRLLPMIGQGSVQNIDDILYLKGIDVGIVQSDVFEVFKTAGTRPDIVDSVNYISKLFNVEFHLIGGNQIQSIEDLAGKTVSFGVEGSGTSVTATIVFDRLGIKVNPVNLDFDLAVQQVKSGKIAALAYVSGKPTSVIASLKRSDGLHFIPVDYAKPLRDTYYPAFFSYGDYPGLIGKGDRVPAISVGTIMAVYNWTASRIGRRGVRYRKVKSFIDAFFSRYRELKKAPRHPKWREMNIAAEVPGWKRYPPAQERLNEELRKRKNGT
jgi:TRAP transporter TAXI family solute receptor